MACRQGEKREERMDDRKERCVIIGGADIKDYKRAASYLRADDYAIYCDSGLRHLEALGAAPSLIVGDWDSFKDPHMDVETITLPVAKDDTDTVYAMREGMKRGYKEFLLLGAMGGRMDHTLVNIYILTALENNGCHGMIADDYSEMELITPLSGTVQVADSYPFFSLVALEGDARGVTIKNAKFCIEDAAIGPGRQYATSNEPLPGRAAEITVKEGRLLLIKVAI